MKKLLNILLLTAALCAFFTGCASTGAKEPLWVTKPEAVYSAAQYLCAVGYAANRKAAEDAAFASLTTYIRQDISIKSVSFEKAAETFGTYSSSYTFDRQVDSVSSIKQLVGAGIQETWNDGRGTAYALAVLNKRQASAYYADKVAANNESVAKLIDIARQRPASFESYAALRAAVPIAEENEAHLAILACVDPARRAMLQMDHKNPAALFIAAEEESKKIALSVRVSGDIDDRITSSFTGVFRQIGVKVQTGAENQDYIFACDAHFKTLPPAQSNVFIRYSLNGTLTDTRTSKTAYTFTFTGKDGHITEAEAIQRSLRSIESYINTRFAQELTAALSAGN